MSDTETDWAYVMTKTTWQIFGLAWAMQRPKLAYVHSVKGRRVKTISPHWLNRRIVHTWNWIACRIVGHDHMLDGIPETYDENRRYSCGDCSKRLTPTAAKDNL